MLGLAYRCKVEGNKQHLTIIYSPYTSPHIVVVEAVVVAVPSQMQSGGRGHVGHSALQLDSRTHAIELLPQHHAPLVQDVDSRLCGTAGFRQLGAFGNSLRKYLFYYFK